MRPDRSANDMAGEEVIHERPMKPHPYNGAGSNVLKTAEKHSKGTEGVKLIPHKRRRGGMVDGKAAMRCGNRPGQKKG